MPRLLLALLVIAGFFILWPYQNFQEYLSQGDHGRDLYAAQAVLRGEAPYKDFWWVYGPLSPYFYGLCYKVFGFHIASIIIGKLLLKLLAAIFLYAALTCLISPLGAFAAGIWFLIFHQDFFFTYNHIAGIAMITATLWALCRYIKTSRLHNTYWALFFILILGLIKINFALAALATTVLLVFSHDRLRKLSFNSSIKKFYVVSLLGLPLVLYAIYALLLNGLSPMEIRQCLPYLGDDQPYNTSPLIALQSFISITWNNMISNWMNISMAVIIIASLLRCSYLWATKAIPLKERQILLLGVGLLVVFYVANFHEFLKSGVWYRCYWSQPMSIALCFILIDTATRYSHSFWRKFTFGLMFLIACIAIVTSAQHLQSAKMQQQAFIVDGNTIYLSNQPSWIATVSQTTEFLKNTLKENDLFFALPYDCLYYYLTGKKSPTRQLIFFEHIKVPPEQERAVIDELEKNHVNYVLVSSRALARMEHGLGVLGQTYCPRISDYINKNFKPIARFGDWTNEPGWAWNHGTLILKRK